MNSTLLSACIGLTAGGAAGAAYFGGLWWTLTRAVGAARPSLLLGVSFLVRLAAALFVFYALLRLGWEAAAAGMAGFLLSRRLWVAARRPLPAKGGKRDGGGLFSQGSGI